jgi:hypothetical protein
MVLAETIEPLASASWDQRSFRRCGDRVLAPGGFAIRL